MEGTVRPDSLIDGWQFVDSRYMGKDKVGVSAAGRRTGAYWRLCADGASSLHTISYSMRVSR